ncbi:glycosyltransferase, partial [Lacisediminihabitans changchengi]
MTLAAVPNSHVRPASLVLTVLNEGHSLPTFLRSLSAQRHLPSEVVIVDGGSADDTVEILTAWSPPAGTAVRIVERPGANISQGRNTAISLAESPWILVTDGGTVLDPGWIESLLDSFDGQPTPTVVSGFFRPTGESLVERAIAFTATPRLTEIDSATFLPSSRSIAFTRDAWSQAGG